MAEDAWMCPVCYRERVDAESRYAVKGCGHQFCVKCLAEHVWRQQTSRRPACPICRQPMLSCGPWQPPEGQAQGGPGAGGGVGAGLLLPLQVGRVRFQVRLDAAGPPSSAPSGALRAFLGRLFGLDLSRLKLVLHGRVVREDAELRAAAQAGAAVALLASRGQPAPRGERLRAWAAALLRRLWAALAAALGRWASSPAGLAVRSLLGPLGGAVRAFVASLHPSFAPPPGPAGGGAGGPAARDPRTQQ
ncbi:hypothetical protein HYH03_015355 [Edaphochlamys debaryana]|uniref:RING-type domain-containing protein n=1 Tax=Edaphochlamys debaryana TaxID=47281 RepID=A0A835XL90_9CHLO|nr:hypothetical protein HYH03_015355 [Edaphochlamys debaryana]|eukprot:KAG2485911.1 hypothetical protein HYH03_015355 [Edaphochlamys debaryana]